MRRLRYLCVIPILAACHRQQAVLEKNVTPVRLTALELYTPGGGSRYSASILPNRQANLSFRVNGIVDSIAQVRGADGRARSIDFGDIVRSGEVLARVRQIDYELQVAQVKGQANQAHETEQAARAQLAQAIAAATKAQEDFGRADALFKKSSLTRSDYDAAKANYDSTRAQVQAAQSQVLATAGSSSAAQAALGTANLGLHDTSLTSPFAGTVVQRSIDVGALAGPSAPAFVIADISAVKASFGVSDIVVAHLRKGGRLAVYAEAFPDRRFQGFVSALASVADSSTRSFQVEVTIPNEQGLLKPGMIASLDLGESARAAPVTVAPLSAIVRSPDNSSKFAVVVVEGDVARRKAVALGATYGDLIAVSGVPAGQKVVSSGATFVADGDLVQVAP